MCWLIYHLLRWLPTGFAGSSGKPCAGRQQLRLTCVTDHKGTRRTQRLHRGLNLEPSIPDTGRCTEEIVVLLQPVSLAPWLSRWVRGPAAPGQHDLGTCQKQTQPRLKEKLSRGLPQAALVILGLVETEQPSSALLKLTTAMTNTAATAD